MFTRLKDALGTAVRTDLKPPIIVFPAHEKCNELAFSALVEVSLGGEITPCNLSRRVNQLCDRLNDQKTGHGKITLAGGDVYEGNFLNGQMTGLGTLTCPNGDVYEGDFLNDQMTGLGKLTWSNGSVYKGNWLNDQMTGWGTLTFPNGDVYKGDFFNGQRSGRGTLTFLNRGVYEGDWLNDQMTGWGTLTYPNGDVYEGEWLNNNVRSNVSNLGDLTFIKLLIGKSTSGMSPSYSLGILSDYLISQGYKDFGGTLRSTYLILLENDPANKSKEIHEKLQSTKDCHLLFYRAEDHGMGLNLVPDSNNPPQFVYCDIFNSGKGLEYHEFEEKNSLKYKTMLRVKVPIEEVTPSMIHQWLMIQPDVDTAYMRILTLPGAEKVEDPDSKWQTCQKSDNCSLEWMFAYLKHVMSDADYCSMRGQLFSVCKKTVLENDEISLPDRQKIIEELTRKENKRNLKIMSFSLGNSVTDPSLEISNGTGEV